jgi:hypothetical protein
LFDLIVENSEMTKLLPSVLCTLPWRGTFWLRLGIEQCCDSWGFERGHVSCFLSFWSPPLMAFQLKSVWWHAYSFGFVFQTQSWQRCLMVL